MTVRTATKPELGRSVPVLGFPLAILSDPDGRIAFVSGAESTAVEVIDLETRNLVTTLDTQAAGAPSGHGLAYVPVT